MNPLESLVPVALVGTERQTVPTVALPAAFQPLLDTLGAAEAPERLLRLAGVVDLAARAGAQAGRVDAPAAPPAEETLRAPDDPELLATFAEILADGPDRLRAELFLRLRHAGMRLPPRLLPAALGAATAHADLRPLLAPVLGARGLWLAGLNPDWSHAAGGGGDAEEITWTEGSLERRVAFLRHERQRDAAAARARLTTIFAKEGARERAALLAALDPPLPDDIPFLESARADRGREVRALSARLLARLPASPFALRQAERIRPLLERKLFRWHLEPPAACPPEWREDGIEPARPNGEPLGERAWWLLQLTRAAPLAVWTEVTGMTPAKLLEWAGKTDWADALRRGWREATLAQRDAAWADALVLDPSIAGVPGALEPLLALLDAPARERHWLGRLQAEPDNAASLVRAFADSRTLDDPAPGPDLCRALVRAWPRVAELVVTSPWLGLRALAEDLATLLPLAFAREAVAAWRPPADAPPSAAEAQSRLLAILRLREQLSLPHEQPRSGASP